MLQSEPRWRRMCEGVEFKGMVQQLETVTSDHVDGFGRAKRQLHLTKYGLSDTWGVIFNNG